MARPKVKEPKKQYTIMLKPSVVKEIDRLAEKVGKSRSKLMSVFIELSLEDAAIFEKMGLIDLVLLGGKLASSLKKKLLRGEVKVDNEGEIHLTK